MKETNLKILALIPARSGSKGITDKNIINLGGHPLIAYSVVAAKLSKFINRIIVSTDSEEYAKIAEKYGAEVPFLRPVDISGDYSTDREWVMHALDFLKENENYVPNLIVHLRPTTPLRDFRLIDKAIEEMITDKKATSLRSSHILKETPYKLFKKAGGYYDFFCKQEFKEDEEYHNYPRQKFPVTFKPNGYIDIIKPETIKRTNMLHGKFIHAFITDKTADLDIIEDLKYAEKILNNDEFRELRKKVNEVL
ncbi:acylneuraminate cytidylyltransferase family protein [Candidatus Woesearchaeota archaeon]|nr:acylneuraminate cytidylyltransferase family protein [Candidatus Woesearchaeota archaeon]